MKTQTPLGGRRRRQSRRYLLGGAAWEVLFLVGRRVREGRVGWLCGLDGGCRGGGPGRWLCAEAAASEEFLWLCLVVFSFNFLFRYSFAQGQLVHILPTINR